MSDERTDGDATAPPATTVAEGTPVTADAAVTGAANDDAPLQPSPQPTRSQTVAARYRVTLPAFEGPLDLLLHLVQEHQIDVLDLPVAFITEKYLEYLELMHVLNLDVAGEYLLMSATLAHIKSKMLLPKTDSAAEDEEEEEADPRGSLVRRLLEYQKYKQAAQELAGRPLLTRDVFTRAPLPEDAPREDAPLAEVSVFQLLEAFAQVIKRVGGRISQHEVQLDRLSVSERIGQLSERLHGVDRIEFTALFDDLMERHQLIVTFLALLEMTRLKMLRLMQDVPRGPIFITTTGVQSASTASEDAFEYKRLDEPLPAPRPLSEEERAALHTIDSAAAGERNEEDAYDAFDDDEGDDADDDDDDDDVLPPR